MKDCKSCGKNKPLEEYYVTTNPGKTLRSDCKECVRAYAAEYFQLNKEKAMANQRLRRYLIKKRG